jgi:haloacetate dehalogenase
MSSFDTFATDEIDTGDTRIFVRSAGAGNPVLLLHGFPETHLMWRSVAPLLAQHFSVVCADLRGYGQSGCPPSTDDHAPYSKRALASDMLTVMRHLGHSHFAVVGHDRGGRVAYRLALDHHEYVQRLAVLDIVPTLEVWERADQRFALGFWPWSLLAQPSPLPERLLALAPDAVVDDAITAWGSLSSAFPPDVRRAYVEALRDPARIHAICEEYRAAASIDIEHDRADRDAGKRIECPVLALWGNGALATWYADAGGPVGVWGKWAENVTGAALDAGHFFPEEIPEQTAEQLTQFLGMR